jgi:hypothetical protein
MAYESPTITDPSKLEPVERWRTEIDYAEKALDKWLGRGRTVVRRYLDERDAIDSQNKWFNLFHANTNILRAALYAQLPKPEVQRKFIDYTDDVARVAANILQRALTPDKDDPRDLFDAVMRHAVFDRLVPGLGTAWLRLETDTEEVQLQAEANPEPGEGLAPPESNESTPNEGFATPDSPDNQPLAFSRITDQRVAIDYVYWEDFLWSPCRVWEERRWVGRKVYMTKGDLVKRFGEEKGNAVPLDYNPSSASVVSTTVTFPSSITPTQLAIKQAVVYEIWDRVDRKVIWYCKGCEYLLDEREDFLKLVGFDPCPKPLLANVATNNTVPRPDFYLVQDQYNELDTVNNRISLLIQACKVVGVYDRASDGVQRMLQEGTDNILIPVDNWAAFAEKGGVKGQVDWLPLEQVIATLQRLYESRELIKQQIFELTGIADILRGASKASETLGAQEIKAKFASVRIKDIQDEVARFAGEILRIKAELMIKHFTPDILIKKSNIMHTDDAELVQPALELLQSEVGFEWRVVITSDQLAQTDYQMEKGDRIELLTAVAQYLAQAGQMIATQPQSGPLLVAMLKWAVAGFKGARDIEAMLDRELDNMMKQLAEGEGEEQPDPEQQKAEAEMKKIEMETQASQQKAEIDGKLGQQKLQFGQAKAQQDLRANAMKHQQAMQQAKDKTMMGALQAAMNPPTSKRVQ